MTASYATISKYPPYISGHSHQAYWLNREFAALLERPQHQVSYCGPVPAWYRDNGIVVHDVTASPQANGKVPDGHLLKALSARLAALVQDAGVSALLALYADPHAAVALRAARTSRMLGHPVRVAVSVEGSDITSSLACHAGDGEAAVLLSDIVSADVVMAVSQRARALLLQAAAELPHSWAAEDLAARIVVRYPGLPPESFRLPDPAAVLQWRHSLQIPAESHLISTFVRLVPEKGVWRILQIAELARDRDDLVFAVAGAGPLAEPLEAEVRRRGLTSVHLLGSLSQPQAHLLRAATSVALLPSQRSADWEETFGIAAVEYQALGVPVLASDCPGFAESCASPIFRIPQDAPAAAWLQQLDEIISRRERLSALAARFASGFTSRRSALVAMEAIEPAPLNALALPR